MSKTLCDLHGYHSDFHCPECIEMDNTSEDMGFNETNLTIAERLSIIDDSMTHENSLVPDWSEE